jgi:hypothetical protein
MGTAAGLVLVWLALPGRAQSTRHVDGANHFEAQIPAGWYPIQQSLVDAVDQELEQRFDKKRFRYLSGYSTSKEGEMTYPYVLFQITEAPMNRASEAELLRTFNAESLEGDILARAEVLSDVMTDLKLEANWDAARQRMIMPMTAEVPGVGPVRGVAVARVGSHGLVQINCYAQASEFDTTMPVFQEWIDSMRIEDGYHWQPGSEWPIDWKEVGWMALVGGIVGGLGTLIFGRLRRS